MQPDEPAAGRRRSAPFALNLSRQTQHGILGFLVVYAAMRSIVAAATKPLWFDELLTQAVSSQPQLRGMWDALSHAVDGQGPLFYLSERASASLVSNQEIALRLPGIAAFACTMICVFALLKRRCGEVVAILCTILLLLTSLFQMYVVEARAYAAVVACMAFAILCYQRIPAIPWTILFGLTLGVAESFHYYAVFLFSAFACAEMALFLETRAVRWRVWLALAFGFLPLALFWPFLSAIRSYYGTHLWKNYTFFSIPGNYGSLFLTGSAFGIALLLISAVGVVASMKKASPHERPEYPALNRSEAVLILALLAMPVILFAATSLLRGSMTDRYTIATILGIVLAIGYALARVDRRIVVLFGACVVLSVALHEFGFWQTRWRHPLRLDSPANGIETLIDGAGNPELPVVVADGLQYLQLTHYASAPYERRLVYLSDENEAVRRLKNDSVERGLQAVRAYLPVRVADFRTFTAAHSLFLLYTDGSRNDFDWLTPALVGKSSLLLLEIDKSRCVYLVRMDTASTP